VLRGGDGDNPVGGGKMDWINPRAWARHYRMESSGWIRTVRIGSKLEGARPSLVSIGIVAKEQAKPLPLAQKPWVQPAAGSPPSVHFYCPLGSFVGI
jgi:hypothetical protein